MVSETIRVGVAKDGINWHLGFLEGLEAARRRGAPLTVELIDIDQNDWLRQVTPLDAVMWKPVFMGPIAASQFRAKVHFMEVMLGKLVVPNVASTWHFENKIAQRHVIEHFGIPTPHTFVSFDPEDALAQLEHEQFPLVFKLAYGAASENVKLVRTRAEARRLVQQTFARQRWSLMRQSGTPLVPAILTAVRERWFGQMLRERAIGHEPFQSIYWQRFLPGNPRDLRITVIGDRYVFAFWRGNRPDDFRASGSGRIQYEEAPAHILQYCLELNRRFAFDTMAYDILFDGDDFVITEMSYAYNDRAIYNAPGHFEPDAAGELRFVDGHRWPQELWGEWAAERIGRTLVSRATQPGARLGPISSAGSAGAGAGEVDAGATHSIAPL